MEWLDALFAIVLLLGWLVLLYVIFRVRRRHTFKRLMREKGFSKEYIEKAIKDEGF